jgi:hypothetical protein
MMAKLVLIVILFAYPWTPDAMSALSRIDVVSDSVCAQTGFYDPKEPGSIHICDQLGRLGTRYIAIHELNHLFSYRYGLIRIGVDGQIKTDDEAWDKFVFLVFKELKTGDYESWKIQWAKHLLEHGNDGRFELHAEVPWLFDGDIPPTLADWYPWFLVESPH